MKTTSISLLCLTLLAAACGAPAEDASDDVATSEDALSASAASYVTLRRDFRRCMAPMCGGYWAKNVNSRAAEVYVSGLDFSQASLDAATQGLVTEAPEVVLRGKLGRLERRFNTRALVVLEAYRGLPGQAVAAGDSFYSVDDKRAVIRCFAAPCNGLTAKKLGTSGRTSFTGYSLEPAMATLVDAAWLESRLGQHGAIVTGHFEKGAHFPAGDEKLLEASQVFIRLPDVIGPCQAQPQARCVPGYVAAFERDANRCLIAQGCVAQHVCTRMPMACEDGYTRQSWMGPSGGCAVSACDPTFSLPPQ